jgi:ankyrin repeat protein
MSPGRRRPMSDRAEFFDAVRAGDAVRVRTRLQADASLAGARDERGASALHYAALEGHREIVRLLVDHGGPINGADAEFGATPAGWAIEYLRELGAVLAVELDDLAYAIEHQDIRWVSRLLSRFPALRQAADASGTPFLQLAAASENDEIGRLFDLPPMPER